MNEFNINDKVKINWENVYKNLAGMELEGDVRNWICKDDEHIITATKSPTSEIYRYELNDRFWFAENEIYKSL